MINWVANSPPNSNKGKYVKEQDALPVKCLEIDLVDAAAVPFFFNFISVADKAPRQSREHPRCFCAQASDNQFV